MDVNYPWFAYYGGVPHRIDYLEVIMNEALTQTAGRCPDAKQVERVDGVVVLGDPGTTGPEMEKELIDVCRQDRIPDGSETRKGVQSWMSCNRFTIFPPTPKPTPEAGRIEPGGR